MASPSARTYEIKAADAFESKLFRQGLFYRLKIVRLTMPPLREGRKDIPVLAAHVIEKFGGKMLAGKCEAFSPGHGARG